MMHPEALWALLLALPIAFAFLYRGRSRPMTVPSLAIWREALGPEGRPPGHRRLREWLLLLANLALLGLLVAGAAAPGQPARGPTAEHWAFVVDVSPSMLAMDGVEGGGTAGPARSRLEAARATVADLAARLPAGSWVTIVSAGSDPIVQGPLPAASSDLPARIAALDWRPGPARLRALDRALAPHPDATTFRVVVLSDGAGLAGLEEFLRDPRRHFIRFGGSAANAGIVSATLDRAWGDPQAELHLEFLLAGPAPAERTWTVSLSGRVLARGTAALEPGQPASVTVPVPTYEVGLLEARLDPADGHPLDDRACLALAPLARPWVRLVTGDRGASFLTPALAALHEHLDAERSGTVSPAEFRPDRLPRDGAGVVIFDGVDPPGDLPPGNYLFFGCGGGSTPLRTGPVADTPTVARWAADHLLLRHAPLEHLQVARSRRALPARADQVLLEGTEGALGVLGSSAGRSFVWFGFRLEDSNLPVLVAYPLLLKNVFAWFAGEQAWLFPPGFRCGEPIRMGRSDLVARSTLLRPTGADAPGIPATLAGRTLIPRTTLAPGWYAAEVDGARGAFGVSLFDPGEIDVRATAVAPRPPTPASGPGASGEVNPPWVRLALWALLALGVEWMLFHAFRDR